MAKRRRAPMARLRWKGCQGSGRFTSIYLVLPRSALPADPLVELHAVALLGGVSALLATDTADSAEELFSVATLGGETTLATGLRPRHLAVCGLGHEDLLLGVRASVGCYPSAPTGKQGRSVRKSIPHGPGQALYP